MTPDIVFVGLGKMGRPMATHLARAGHTVRGVEPQAAARVAAEADGLPVVASLDQALSQATAPCTVVSSLPDDTALLAVADELRRSGRPGDSWVDTSTVSPAASLDARTRVTRAGLSCLCAPVSGNAVMAVQAQLTVFASGDADAFARCQALFACWGPRCLYLGAGDEARVAKLAVNLMVAATSGMLAEALAFGSGLGVPTQTLWQVIEDSAVASPLLRAKAPALRAGDYRPTFTVRQMQKDLSLIRSAAADVGAAVPMANLVHEALTRAEARGAGDLDYAVIVRDAGPSLPAR